MDYIEAIAWLNGERSMCNQFYHNASESENADLLTAQADAAKTQQAYWIVRARHEGLTEQQASEVE
jgi:hypothetical protein